MPHALELPGMLCAVVPLMRGERLAGVARPVVDELVACGLRRTWGARFSGRRSGLVPGLTAIVGTLDQLPKPAAGLRRIQPIRIGGRSLDVIHLPARELRAADLPVFALAICGQDKRALACTNQYSYLAH